MESEQVVDQVIEDFQQQEDLLQQKIDAQVGQMVMVQREEKGEGEEDEYVEVI